MIYKPTLFWDVTPCSLIESLQRFGETSCLAVQGSLAL